MFKLNLPCITMYKLLCSIKNINPLCSKWQYISLVGVFLFGRFWVVVVGSDKSINKSEDIVVVPDKSVAGLDESFVEWNDITDVRDTNVFDDDLMLKMMQLISFPHTINAFLLCYHNLFVNLHKSSTLWYLSFRSHSNLKYEQNP